MMVVIVANRQNPKTFDAMYQIVAYLDSLGIEHAQVDVSELPDSAFPYGGSTFDLTSHWDSEVELIITLGGDGTLLHSSRLAYALDAPILGLNFGHLGFLTNSAEEGLIAPVVDALSGEIVSEERINLHIQVKCFGDDGEQPDTPREFFALNEIAVARGALGHIVDYDFSVSGDRIARMRGDGLVLSTATGSTAYALSAGGPLVGPSFRGMIAVPLAPHTLNSRAVVCEHHDVIEIRFGEDSASSHEVSLFADGDVLNFGRPIESVTVSTGDKPITLLTKRNESFYRQIARTFFK